jgi:hypothetical protein
VSTRNIALLTVVASAAALVGMLVVSVTTGATQEHFEHVIAPTDYAAALREQATGVRWIFALDIAFIVLYTAFFAALADILRKLGRPFVALALGALLATSVLDIVENHHILSLLGAAEHGLPIDADALVLQQTLSATKFSISYISLFLFGLAIPRTTRLGWTLSLFLTVGTLVTGVASYAAPPAARAQLDSGRWIGFLIGFALAALWLRQAPEPDAPAG